MVRTAVVIFLAVSLPMLAGCDRWEIYSYSGTLVSGQTGAPLAQQRVEVSAFGPRERIEPGFLSWLERGTRTTDPAGHYSGSFAGDMTSPIFPHPAKVMDRVYVYYKSPSGWERMSVALTADDQNETGAGFRVIQMPLVKVPTTTAGTK